MIKKNKLFLILTLSLIMLSTTLIQRVNMESNNKTVDITLDYEEMKELSIQSDEDIDWWFEKFKELGVNYVGLYEETLESMINDNKDVNVVLGSELLENSTTRELYLNESKEEFAEYEITEYDILVNTESEENFNFIYNGLTDRYNKELFEVISDTDEYNILLRGTIDDAIYPQNHSFVDAEGKGFAIEKKPYTSKLIKLGLGFDQEKIESIQESGLQVLPRPYNHSPWTTDKYINALFNDYESFNMIPPVFIFTGDKILGYPDYNYMVAEYMQENDVKVGLVESSVQRGHIEQEHIEELTRGLEYDAVRIFSVWPYIQERFQFYNYEGAEEIENTLYRAVTERNIRLIYFKPFKYDSMRYVTDYEEYEAMFNSFENRIDDHGMKIGTSDTFEPNRVRISSQVLMGWGIVAAGVLLLSSVLKTSTKIKDGVLIAGMSLVPVGYIISQSLMEKIMALGASIIFPSLAMVWVCYRCKKYFNEKDREDSLFKTIAIAAKDLTIATIISLIGGLFVAGILSNTDFLLEIDIFRGIKVSQLLPIVIYVVTYLAYFGYKNKNKIQEASSLNLEDIKRFLFEDIKIVYVLLGTILLIVGYIYIARTGHETNIQPSTFEMIARNMLEQNLLARPRTKEFLIAFPALMVAIYFAKNKNNLLLFFAGLGAIIGQTSIANTFSHLRSPIYLSTIRTIYSLGFGIIMGVIYIILIEIAFKVFKLLFARAEKGRN